MLLSGDRLPLDQHAAFQTLIQSSFIPARHIERPQTPGTSRTPLLDGSHTNTNGVGISASKTSWSALDSLSSQEMNHEVAAVGKILC
jgi:hypothetical protein